MHLNKKAFTFQNKSDEETKWDLTKKKCSFIFSFILSDIVTIFIDYYFCNIIKITTKHFFIVEGKEEVNMKIVWSEMKVINQKQFLASDFFLSLFIFSWPEWHSCVEDITCHWVYLQWLINISLMAALTEIYICGFLSFIILFCLMGEQSNEHSNDHSIMAVGFCKYQTINEIYQCYNNCHLSVFVSLST